MYVCVYVYRFHVSDSHLDSLLRTWISSPQQPQCQRHGKEFESKDWLVARMESMF